MNRLRGPIWLSALLALAPLAARAQAEAEQTATTVAIQQRSFRLLSEISLGVGYLPLDDFTKGVYGQVGYTIHFSEGFAWQVARGAFAWPLATSLRQQLVRDFNKVGPFPEVQLMVGSDLIFKPLYGKMTFLNRAVLYGELYLMVGGTAIRYWDNFLRPAVSLGGGGRLFLARWFSLKLEFTHNIVIPTGGNIEGLSQLMTLTLSMGFNMGGAD